MDEGTPKDEDEITNKRKRLLGHNNQESAASLPSANAPEPKQGQTLSPPLDAIRYQLHQLPEEALRNEFSPKPPTPSVNPLFVHGQSPFQGIHTPLYRPTPWPLIPTFMGHHLPVSSHRTPQHSQ